MTSTLTSPRLKPETGPLIANSFALGKAKQKLMWDFIGQLPTFLKLKLLDEDTV